MRNQVLKTILIIVVFTAYAHSAVWYVYDGASGTGTSWANAYGSIQSAINAASAGDEILVGYGSSPPTTYTIGSQLDINDKNVKITSASYDNDNSYASAQYDSSKVIISGGGSCRLFYIHGGAVTSATVIRGFKLTNGNATGSEFGGAIYCNSGADPTITNCWITGNVVNANSRGRGGGIASEDVTVTITNNLIEYNISREDDGGTSGLNGGWGGGLYIQGGSATITGNIIRNNTANNDAHGEGSGGGIYTYNNWTTISNNTIQNNTACVGDGRGYGGGICHGGNGGHTVENNTISNNVANSGPAEGHGGGMYVFAGDNQTVTIQYNTFKSNTAATAAASWANDHYGGAIFTDRGNCTIKYNIFDSNVCLSATDDATNNAWGGAAYLKNGTIENNVFSNNANRTVAGTAGGGSGVYFAYNNWPSSFINNAFINHNEEHSDKIAVYAKDFTFNISNCGFHNNTNNFGGDAGDGGSNIFSDPKFTDTTSSDFSLLYNSPYIEAGSGDYSYDEDSNHDYGWKKDIGAEEYSGTRVSVAISATGTVYFGGKVRAKANVTTQGTLSNLDITVHENDTHSNAGSSVSRWYSITATGSDATVDVTLSYKDSELNGETEASLGMWRWTGSNWDGPKAASASSTTDNWITCTGQSSFSDWILSDAQNESSLPVCLSDFSVLTTHSGIQLYWTTESEVDNLGFFLDRKQLGSDWFEIASYLTTESLKGHGSTNQAHGYTYLDTKIDAGIRYDYRLRDVDYSGKETIHSDQIVSVTSQQSSSTRPDKPGIVQAYPNPFNPSTSLHVNIVEPGLIELAIYDSRGREVRTLHNGFHQSGQIDFAWDGKDNGGKNLDVGVYLCAFRQGTKLSTHKLALIK